MIIQVSRAIANFTWIESGVIRHQFNFFQIREKGNTNLSCSQKGGPGAQTEVAVERIKEVRRERYENAKI